MPALLYKTLCELAMQDVQVKAHLQAYWHGYFTSLEEMLSSLLKSMHDSKQQFLKDLIRAKQHETKLVPLGAKTLAQDVMLCEQIERDEVKPDVVAG
jgi:hypothetical protein